MTTEQALKQYFYGEGTDVLTSTSRVPLLDASGNPIGSTTLANLAAMLLDVAGEG